MVVTDGTSTVEKKESETATETQETLEIEVSKTKDYDIVKTLESIGHITSIYPNGLVLGVHTEGIPGRRGVHVDLAYVLDLRRASFGSATIAMQAALLETLNRDLNVVLRDVDLDGQLVEVSKLTSRGRMQLQMLRANSSHPGSLIHITRTVYVITNDGRPSADLSWLTEPSRILNADDFLLARKSDMRAFLSEMQNRVVSEKWNIFNESMMQGWFSILALSFCVVGAASLLGAVLMGLSSMLLPLAATSGGGATGAWMLRNSRKKLDEFHELLEIESMKTNKIGDGHRLDQSVLDNQDKLSLQRDLGFVVSPLMASVAGSIGIGDYEDAVTTSGLVLDECVRYSQSDSVAMGDEGLSKFIGLFHSLGLEVDEAELSLCYVGLSNHITSPLNEDEVMAHATILTNTLYNSGVLRPSVKDRIDDLMNARALKENLRFLDDVITSHVTDETEVDEINHDWVMEELETGDLAPEQDDMPVIVAATADEEAVDYDAAESQAIADQLDALSDITKGEISDTPEQTARDIVNSASKPRPARSRKKKKSKGAEEDDPAE
ncbi:MAG: hypothetical protein ACW98Y_14205 [Candidatus Thorarchaeota archaeon]|jgi:hypothetical protein